VVANGREMKERKEISKERKKEMKERKKRTRTEKASFIQVVCYSVLANK
jgi:hypothetical protein